MNKPAILGGKPVFKSNRLVSILRPSLPQIEDLMPRLKRSLQTGQITNSANVVRFEEKAAEYLGARYCVAVSSCTAGLMLLEKSLGLKGEVIVPSFTFHATTHSLLWNNLKPIFVDCRKDTFNIDESKIEQHITKKTSAILAVYIYGNPPDIKRLQKIADRNNLKLIFDSAHAFGSSYKGLKAGRFGNAEVFSLSPTKLLITGEGGLVTTNDKLLADNLRVARNYGDSGDYDCAFNGLNARMAEFNAILGIQGLRLVDKKIARRNKIAHLYRDFFKNYDGISFQEVEGSSRSTFKDFSIVIDPNKLGIDRDLIAISLEKEHIMTKKYFYPPVHSQKAYSDYNKRKLPVTDILSRRVLSLPIYYSLDDEVIDGICDGFSRIFKFKDQIKDRLKNEKKHN